MGLETLFAAQPRAVRVFSHDLQLLCDFASPEQRHAYAPYHDNLGHTISWPTLGLERDDWPVFRARLTHARAERFYDSNSPAHGEEAVYRVMAWPLPVDGQSKPLLVEEIEIVNDTARRQHLKCEEKLRHLDEQVSVMLNSVIDFLSAESEGDLLRLRLTNPNIHPCHELRKCGQRRCPSREADDMRCWEVNGTHCPDAPGAQEMLEKFHFCSQCDVYLLACPDPLSRVGENFNRLLTLLQLKYQEALEAHHRLQQTEKVATLGEMMLGIAHEIKNPLGIIIGRLECLELEFETMTREEMVEDVSVILQQAARVKSIIDQLLKLGRPHPPKLQPVPVDEIFQNVLPMVRKTLERSHIDLGVTMDAGLPPIHADGVEIQQVLMNLILNARDAMPRGGAIALEAAVPPGTHTLVISVADTGQGIAPENIERIFSPFYSTKSGGTGLGLAVCRRIMRRHGGDILVDSEVNRGTTFRLNFPLTQVSAAIIAEEA